MRYVLNNYYVLRHDKSRTFILGGKNGRVNYGNSTDPEWKSIIHPAYAMMLSFFSEPVELEDAVAQISEFFSMKREQIRKFITQIIETNECVHTDLNGFQSGFPRNLIIPFKGEDINYSKYSPDCFKFSELDFKTRRMLSAPLSIVWMPNNNCYTSCEYCYADRSLHKNVNDLEKISAFIDNTVDAGVVEIMITGGDFFENPQWREILKIIISRGYNIDMISTKKPLSKQELSDFKKYNIRLQISLDSICPSVSSRLLRVKDCYTDQIKEFIYNVSDSGINFQIATVLTNINDSIENLDSIYDFIKGLKWLCHWEIRIAFRSLYSRVDFDDIKSNRTQINKISNWIQEKRSKSKIEILWSPDDDSKYKKSSGGSKYFEGPVCAANMTNLIVLPDGNVTICEQLYWKPEFIIGNVYQNTIQDIWNSDKAIHLWRRSQQTISSNSPCRSCRDFTQCFENGNRCFANILKAYGDLNSDYPDPRCILAPEYNKNIEHE